MADSIDWAAAANWVSAFGTIMASYVALRLARRTEQPRVQVFAWVEGVDNLPSEEDRIVDGSVGPFTVAIRNLGHTPIAIDYCAVTVGHVLRSRALSHPRIWVGSPLLSHGETVLLRVDLDLLHEAIARAARRRLLGRLGERLPGWLSVEVDVTNGSARAPLLADASRLLRGHLPPSRLHSLKQVDFESEAEWIHRLPARSRSPLEDRSTVEQVPDETGRGSK